VENVNPVAVIKHLQTRIGELELDRAVLSSYSDELLARIAVMVEKSDRYEMLAATLDEQVKQLSARLEENGISP
jgi:hypothetical protein